MYYLNACAIATFKHVKAKTLGLGFNFRAILSRLLDGQSC